MNSAGEKVFDVIFDMGTSSGGVPIDWVGFNPQPEPPGINGDACAIGFDFQFDSYSEATLQFQVLDVDSDPISFTLIPEPTTWVLLASGGACLLLLTIRRRRDRAGVFP
ncbi:MAG: PEP-CTERM sorting domain-containing protein [Planctomycetes bacterium]|nr:PEP-CTERM sorting domain-containing protein [Planctomycetota bacterium]MBU4398671.1 PEP-CTERM sorting domain-containing protein [Planctomycetota bacterium]MCG2685600.1 PEP-CTERM sorting domain-containing protein [Planctomycetales bacterium]